MRNKILILLTSFFFTFSVVPAVLAYSTNSINKKILVVQAEITSLEETLAEVETPEVRKIGEKKLQKYIKEITQLRRDLQIEIYREKVRRDRKRLQKHR